MTPLRLFTAGACSGALAVFLIIAADKAHAQQPCMPLMKVLEEITGPRYSEGPAFKGVIKSPDGKTVALMGFANRQTRTFTILLRPSADVACPVMDGAEFEMLEADPPKPGQGT